MTLAVLRTNRRLVSALAASALFTLVIGAWLIFSWGGVKRTEQIDDISQFVIAFLAAAACAFAAWRLTGRRRLAWGLIGASAFCWGLGEVVWSYYELLKGQQVPFPSFADLGYLLAVPLAIAGVLFFPLASRASSLIRTVLDGLVIAGSLLIVSWATVLGTVYRAGTGGALSQIISLAYPAGDVVIGTMILILATRAPASTRLPLILLGGGLFANLLADSAFAYLTTTNRYGPGNPVDIGWVAGYLLVAIAALRASAEPAPRARDDAIPGRFAMVLPYIPVTAGALTAGIERHLLGRVHNIIFFTFVLVVVLVVVRQFLMLADNQALTRQLQSNTAALRQREEHFRSLVHNSSDVITLIDSDGTIRYTSGSIERIFGYGGGRLIGTHFGDLVHTDDRTQVLRRIEEAINIEGPPISIECRLQREDGSFCSSEVTITNLLKWPAVEGLVLNTRDVTERKVLEEKLTHQAFHDSLTNLPNRAAFRVVLDHALSGTEQRRIAVLFLDLDDFKAVNDTLGHEAGDQLLQAVAKRIEATLRPGDSVARLGGDEFAVLLKNMEDETIAARVADRITRQLSTSFAIDGRELFIHASIGIAGLVSGQEAAEDLLKNADVAMYIAKARGKARYVEYEASLHRAAVDRMQLEKEMQEALAHQEFVLHYQPVVMLETGAVHSVEALVRWNHPRRGLLYPGEFISLAEQTGMIAELGRWVLQQAARDARRWQVRYPSSPPVMVSVNVSGHQLNGSGILADVSAAVDAAGLDPQALILELTESVLMEGTADIAQTLQELRARGVRLALDDFGTGYSSLGHLRDFPVDILKLDRSFVSGLGSGLVDGAILRAVIGLGNTLGLLTIGEGIERPEQLAALNAMGCHAGQGYHLSRPLPVDQMDALLAACLPTATGRQLRPAWKLTA